MKTNKVLAKIFSSRKSTAFTVVGLFVVIGLGTLIYSHADSISATLSLSPSSQTVTNGSDVTVTLVVNPDGNSINTVQTVLSYPAANFSLVSAVGGSSFGNFIDTPGNGSLSITAASTTAVTSSAPITVATITFAANSSGSSLPVSLANVCPSGNYAVTCSAVYDSTTSDNDLSSVGSPASYTVNALPPNAPTNFVSAAVTTTSASLSWTASTDTNGTIGGYYLYRYITSAGASSATKIATKVGADTSYTDTGLTPGTGYSYYVEAYDTSTPASLSTPSSTVAVTTIALPTAPANLAKTSSTTNSITLGWTASTDQGGPGLGGYYLYKYVTSAGASSATKIATLNSSANSYTDSGLSSNTSYSYYLAAFDDSTTLNLSATSTTLTATTSSVIVPSTPTGLAKTASSAYTISLSWTASTDTGGSGLGGYYLFRNGTKLATITAPTTTYLDTGLTIGSTYSYYLEAFDTAASPNISAASATISPASSDIIGDLDGDNQVTGHDVSDILSYYGKAYVPAEFDGYSVVEGHDISMLLSNYGK